MLAYYLNLAAMSAANLFYNPPLSLRPRRFIVVVCYRFARPAPFLSAAEPSIGNPQRVEILKMNGCDDL